MAKRHTILNALKDSNGYNNALQKIFGDTVGLVADTENPYALSIAGGFNKYNEVNYFYEYRDEDSFQKWDLHDYPIGVYQLLFDPENNAEDFNTFYNYSERSSSGFDGTTNTIAIQSDGKILVGGYFITYADGIIAPYDCPDYLCRLNSDGTLDQTFNYSVGNARGFNLNVNTIVVLSNGKILVGGYFTTYDDGIITNTDCPKYLCRLNADGTLDQTFNYSAGNTRGGDEEVTSIVVQSDGKIIVGGWWTAYSDGIITPADCPYRLCRLNADGTLDQTFNYSAGNTRGFNDGAYSVALQSDGKIIVCGNFTSYTDEIITPADCPDKLCRLNADGTLDQTFNYSVGVTARGFSSLMHAVAIQSDGKILVGGTVSAIYTDGLITPGDCPRGISRINTNGTLDQTFNYKAGITGGLNGATNTIAIQSDGKILVGGSFTSYTDGIIMNTSCPAFLCRLNTTGTVDQTFNYFPLRGFFGINGTVSAIAVQSDGKILVGGLFTSYTDEIITPADCPDRLCRLNADGTLDQTFNYSVGNARGFDNTVYSIAIQSDGKILVGGNFTTYDDGIITATHAPDRLCRLNANGTLDQTFNYTASTGRGFNGTVYAIAIQSDGKILVGGNFSSYTDGVITATHCPDYVCRLNTNGTLDQTFNYTTATGRGCGSQVNAIAVQSDGKILVGGTFVSYADGIITATHAPDRLCRLNAGGTLDQTFNYTASTGRGFGGTVYAIVIQSDGKILVGGTSVSYTDGIITPADCPDRLCRVSANGTLDTSFNYSVGVTTRGFSAGTVQSVVRLSDDTFVVGGLGLVAYTDATGSSLTICDNLCSIDTDGTLIQSRNYNGICSTAVNAIAVVPYTNEIYCGVANTSTSHYYTHSETTYYRINKGLLKLKYDLSLDTTFNGLRGFTFTDDILYKTILQSDGKVLAGGSLSSYTDGVIIPADCPNYLCRLNADGTLDTTFNYSAGNTRGFDNTLRAIAIQSDSKILVGGAFTQYIDSTGTLTSCPDRFCRVNSDGTLDQTFNYGSGRGFNGTVYAVTAKSDGKILVGGNFDSYTDGLITAADCPDKLCRLNSDGTLDQTFNYAESRGFDDWVLCLAIQSDSKIIVGGGFTEYADGVTTASYCPDSLCRLNSDGTLDTSFNYAASRGFNDQVRAIAIQSDGKILVGGSFTTYDDGMVTAADCPNRFCRVNSDGTLDKTFNYSAGITTRGFDGAVYSIVIQSDGMIVVGGGFTSYTDENGALTSCPNYLCRLTSTGALDQTFNSEFDSSVYDIQIDADDTIFCGGSFTQLNNLSCNNRLVKLTKDGYIKPIISNQPIQYGITPVLTNNCIYHLDNTYTDEYGNTSWAATNTTFSNTVSKFGTYSLYFNGTTAYATNSGITLGSKPFTYECWVYFTSSGTHTVICSAAEYGILIQINTSGKLLHYASSDGSTWDVWNALASGATTMQINKWYHIVIEWDGSYISSYINGVQQYKTATIRIFEQTSGIRIGAQYTTPSAYFVGYLSEIRISQGFTRYGGNNRTVFSPPLSSFNIELLYFFNIQEMQMYRYRATAYLPCKAIGIATVDKTAAGTYTIYNYAIHNEYIAPPTLLSVNTTYSFNHNLGVPMEYIKIGGSLKNLATAETLNFTPQSNFDASVNYNNYAGTNQYLNNVKMWVRTGTTTTMNYVNSGGTTTALITASRAKLNLILERSF